MEGEKILRVVELFAGVGGFRVGLEAADPAVYRTVWANQWEPGQSGQWAYRCYAERFGDAAHCVNEDVAEVIRSVPPHELLVGGFPCQDYSVASTGAKGIEGKKGVLWWSIDQIVRRCKPRYILLENVDRLLKSPAKQRGRDFGIILRCLYEAGYAVEWRVINAADYGYVQRRRRTFLFACRKGTKLHRQLAAADPAAWLRTEGLFAGAFPVEPGDPPKGRRGQADLAAYESLLEVSDAFRAAFYNGGVMCGGQVWTEELVPVPCADGRVLGDVATDGPVDERYFLSDAELPKWQVMKGAKRIERTAKTGFTYRFSEGAIAFPDPLDRPARTMLTSEGTANRSSHVIEDPATGRLRRLTPEECERLNGFPPGWTDTGMPERQRYFIMGNALVVPLVERIGRALLDRL